MKKIFKKIKAFFSRLFGKNKIVSPSTPNNTNNKFSFVSFGSPNCSNAKEDPKVQIKDLKWSSKQLSYKWASSTKLEQWGISDPHVAKALACFGYLDAKGVWRFGKIDWISSDRLTRDMHNVNSRYNGIDPAAYFSAKKHGFFIMEANGKRRTNIITV